MFKFPYTNLHELNLDWILEKVKKFSELIPPMETAVEDVQGLQTDVEQAVENANQAVQDAQSAIQTAEEAKEIAEQASQGTIADGAVTSAKLADGAVTSAKIADGSISGNDIAPGTIQTGNLSQGCVTTVQILDGAVTNAKIADSAVTNVKIADNTIEASKLKMTNGSASINSRSDSPVPATASITYVKIANIVCFNCKVTLSDYMPVGSAKRVIFDFPSQIPAPMANQYSTGIDINAKTLYLDSSVIRVQNNGSETGNPNQVFDISTIYLASE